MVGCEIMKSYTTYERLMPDTICGEGIKLTQVYTSFDIREIDELEEDLKKAIGSGVVFEFKESEDKEEGAE
jgi:hypothetical protein